MDEKLIQSITLRSHERAFYYADKILSIAPDFAPFNVSQVVLYVSNWNDEERNEANDCSDSIAIILIKLQYASGDYFLELTDKGRIAKAAGGHFIYQINEKNKQDLQDKKLKIDIKNAERIARSYPYTQFIAWITFAIATFLGFLKIAEALKLWPYHK